MLAIGLCGLIPPGFSEDHTNAAASNDAAAFNVVVDGDATVHLPPLAIPFSPFVTPEAKEPYLRIREFYLTRMARAKDVAEQRQLYDEFFQPALERSKEIYPVESAGATLGSVYVDVITPRGGISARNKDRVLINLHGGGFINGARLGGALESIPVASLGKIKVIAVDYRMAPEFKYPAASEDVAAVYRELLKSYKARNIGIYGCSAGGFLTAEATAWIAKEHLPTPGAIGIFCASADGWSAGDSGVLAQLLVGVPPSQESLRPPHPSVRNREYFSAANFNDPLVAPIRSNAVLARFPPTLIITSTRDMALSSAAYTHTQLVKLGVDAELHVWEGMAHGFFTMEPDLPETREVWDVVTRFFDKHLGVGQRSGRIADPKRRH
jgi:monoterpene epsilon-lactone hydrolase